MALSPGAKKAIIVGSAVGMVAGAVGVVYWIVSRSRVGASVPGLSIAGLDLTSQCAPVSGGAVTVGSHIELHATLTNTAQTAEVGAVEAVTATADGTIVDVWFSAAHPAGSYPGGLVDSPQWFQQQSPLNPGQSLELTGADYSCGAFGSVFQVPFPGLPLRTTVYFGLLPPGYTGPLVTGKNWGQNLSGIRVANSSLKVAQTAGPAFTVPGS